MLASFGCMKGASSLAAAKLKVERSGFVAQDFREERDGVFAAEVEVGHQPRAAQPSSYWAYPSDGPRSFADEAQQAGRPTDCLPARMLRRKMLSLPR